MYLFLVTSVNVATKKCHTEDSHYIGLGLHCPPPSGCGWFLPCLTDSLHFPDSWVAAGSVPTPPFLSPASCLPAEPLAVALDAGLEAPTRWPLDGAAAGCTAIPAPVFSVCSAVTLGPALLQGSLCAQGLWQTAREHTCVCSTKGW